MKKKGGNTSFFFDSQSYSQSYLYDSQSYLYDSNPNLS